MLPHTAESVEYFFSLTGRQQILNVNVVLTPHPQDIVYMGILKINNSKEIIFGSSLTQATIWPIA